MSGSISVVSPGVCKVLFELFKHLCWVWGSILNEISPLLPSCWGFSFAFGCGVSFSGGIQHAPVYCCSVAGGNFGVLTGDECMSFYSISSGRSVSPGKAVLGIENKTYMNCYKFYMLQT